MQPSEAQIIKEITDEIVSHVLFAQKVREEQNLYTKNFNKTDSFFNYTPEISYFEFSECGSETPPLIIGILKKHGPIDLILLKGSFEYMNNLVELKNFGEYSANKFKDVLDMYYIDVCRIIDVQNNN